MNSIKINIYDNKTEKDFVLNDNYEYLSNGLLFKVKKGTRYVYDGLVYTPIGENHTMTLNKETNSWENVKDQLPRTLSSDIVDKIKSDVDCEFIKDISGGKQDCGGEVKLSEDLKESKASKMKALSKDSLDRTYARIMQAIEMEAENSRNSIDITEHYHTLFEKRFIEDGFKVNFKGISKGDFSSVVEW